MAEVKTKLTEESVESFLNRIEDETERKDGFTLVELMGKATGEPPRMWGTAIIGFGSYHYKYESGREGDICTVGFSPRKGKFTLYVLAGFPEQDELLGDLGKHKKEGGCLYIKKMTDVDTGVLERLVKKSFEFKQGKH
jgi:hypothetical protein